MVSTKFEVFLGDRFSLLLEIEITNMEEYYTGFKTIIKATTEEVVGVRARRNVKGLSGEIEEVCEKRRKAQVKMINSPENCQLNDEYKK